MEKLEPKQKGIALERGTWIHDLLMHHYDEEDWKIRHAELTREFNNLFEEEREDLGDLPGECRRIMLAYLRHYRQEDKRYRVIDSEVDEILTLPNGLEFNFIIDLIVEDVIDGGLWLWDHKTLKSFMDSDFMLIDAQLARYFWCAEKMGYTPLRGVMFNEIRTKAPAIPQLLKKGGLSQRKNIDTDVHTYLREIRKYDLDPNDYAALLRRLATQGEKFFRRTKLPKDRPLTKRLMDELNWSAKEIIRAERAGEFPRTPDKSCVWGCSYKDICITELMGGDASSIIKMNFRPRRRSE